MLCQLDRRYARALAHYRKVLTQRNHLLRRLRDEGGHPDELLFWDDQLVSYGATLVRYRLQGVERLKVHAHAIHADLTGGTEALEIAYISSVLKGAVAEAAVGRLPPGNGEVGLPSREQIEEVFRARLRERAPAERARGITLVGPHRADLRLLVNGIDMGLYSSRGQQRTIALALRLAEATLLQEATGTPPLLLLDDVMGELDAFRRRYLMDVVRRHQQAFLTSTDLDDFAPEFLAQARVLHVEGGRVVDFKGFENL
jgi:DNA replication and repair protein RecF